MPRSQTVPVPQGHYPASNGSYGDDISEESHDQSGDIEGGSHDSEEGLQKLPTADPEMVRLETQLDAWCLDLKRNVLVGPRPRQRSGLKQDMSWHYIMFNIQYED